MVPRATNDSALMRSRRIAGFLAKYTPELQKEARAARRVLRTWMPTATEMVYDNYSALVFGFVPGERASEAILSLALFPRWVTLCFLQGAQLSDPDGLLQGNGSVARHIVLDSAADLKKPGIRSLISQALARAKVPLSKSGRLRTVIKSVSTKQRPRRPD
jgi:hypothetical protein